MDRLIRDRLNHIQKTLKAAFDASQELKSDHSIITGTEREIFAANFLREMFPPQFRFGSGAIIDKTGRKTGQLDIVIELPFAPSFTLGHDSPRIYLADTVGAVIEVKSNLKTQWDDFEKQLKYRPSNKKRGKKIYALKELKRRVVVLPRNLSETIPGYVVGYKGFGSLDELKQKMRDNNADENLWIRAALQVDPPLFVAGGENLERYSCEGAEAFGAFIASLDFELQRVIWGHAELWAYFGLNKDEN
ncbi:MAG: hypothetical protein IPM53_18185 [Anaerolineaceae bacterium]|nr:hypothetical protein [Anaerolineaceae bacterium]